MTLEIFGQFVFSLTVGWVLATWAMVAMFVSTYLAVKVAKSVISDEDSSIVKRVKKSKLYAFYTGKDFKKKEAAK